jgi:hypothetical protein
MICQRKTVDAVLTNVAHHLGGDNNDDNLLSCRGMVHEFQRVVSMNRFPFSRAYN